MRTADFHEDDYCQIELLPEENWQHVQAEFLQLEAFSQAHLAPDGAGWTDMYRRVAPPIPLAQLQIDLEELSTRIERHLPRFDRVTTGWSSVVEELPRSRAWGNDASFILFADHADTGVVRNIWLQVWSLPPAALETAVAALIALAGSHQLFLADWGWTQAIRLNDVERLRQYLRAREPDE